MKTKRQVMRGGGAWVIWGRSVVMFIVAVMLTRYLPPQNSTIFELSSTTAEAKEEKPKEEKKNEPGKDEKPAIPKETKDASKGEPVKDAKGAAPAVPVPAPPKPPTPAQLATVPPSNIVDLEPFVVNLADIVESRFARVVIKLEMAKPAFSKDVTARMPEIRDSVLMLLSSKSYAKVRTVEGKMELRDQIVDRVNTILKEGKVVGAYFTEFIVQ